MSTIPVPRRRLLLVEESEEIAFALYEYFKFRGFAVTRAATLDAARAVATRERFDIVLGDWPLDEGANDNGSDLLRSICSADQPPYCVVLTADSSRSVAAHAISCGASAVVAKPAALDELPVVIDRALYRLDLEEAAS